MTGSPSFGRDIRPLFRDSDVQAMDFFVDLASYDDVKDKAPVIYDRLRDGSMPCDVAWPADNVELFRRWMSEGTEP